MTENAPQLPSPAQGPAPRIPGLLSVVIPAADEAATMLELLARLRAVLEPRVEAFEVIVVVPSPDDATGAAAASQGARVLVQKRPGFGGALREGLLAARGAWVATLDADLSHPPEAIPDLLALRESAEVVIASRYVPGGAAAMPTGRFLLSRLLNLVYARVLAMPIHDMSGGFRLYRRSVLDELSLQGEKFDVLEEILVQIYTHGWQLVEVPFRYSERAAGNSHASVVEFVPHFLSTLLRLWRMRNSFTSADYDSRAYDTKLLPQRHWQRRRFTIVTELMGTAGPRLDVGCGSSRIIQAAPDSVGLDIGMAKLRFLRRTNRLLVRGSTFALPFPNEYFGCVVSSQVIEHVPYDRNLFRELNRVLRQGGTLVIGTPDYGRLQWRITERLYKLLLPNAYADDHITHYTRHRLLEELASAGFAIKRYRYIGGGELIVQCVKREGISASLLASDFPQAGNARRTPPGQHSA